MSWFQGKDNTAQNLFYTSENKVVYFTAGIGVVYQRPPVHHQVGALVYLSGSDQQGLPLPSEASRQPR